MFKRTNGRQSFGQDETKTIKNVNRKQRLIQ